jgi:hypothetical protein
MKKTTKTTKKTLLDELLDDQAKAIEKAAAKKAKKAAKAKGASVSELVDAAPSKSAEKKTEEAEADNLTAAILDASGSVLALDEKILSAALKLAVEAEPFTTERIATDAPLATVRKVLAAFAANGHITRLGLDLWGAKTTTTAPTKTAKTGPTGPRKQRLPGNLQAGAKLLPTYATIVFRFVNSEFGFKEVAAIVWAFDETISEERIREAITQMERGGVVKHDRNARVWAAPDSTIMNELGKALAEVAPKVVAVIA